MTRRFVFGWLFVKVCAAACLLAVFAFADGIEVRLNSQSQEDIQWRIGQLELLRKNAGNLDAEQRRDLETLWRDANQLAQLNDRCREVSLNHQLDKACSNFYEVQLPKFEDDYFRITGEIRLSATRVLAEVGDRRQMIEACYESFPLLHLAPRDVFPLGGGYLLSL